jgi:hypothetical protein
MILLTATGGGMLHDPHVATLRYQLETDASLAFGSPATREHDTSTFALRLAGGLLTCDMEAYFASAVAAKAVVEPALRARELDTALRGGAAMSGLGRNCYTASSVRCCANWEVSRPTSGVRQRQEKLVREVFIACRPTGDHLE